MGRLYRAGSSVNLPRTVVNRKPGSCRKHIKYPMELANEMSAFPAVRVGDHAKHGLLLEDRHGAGDENTGSDFAGNGEEDHVVAGGRDSGF